MVDIFVEKSVPCCALTTVSGWAEDVPLNPGLMIWQDGAKALSQGISDNDLFFLDLRCAF